MRPIITQYARVAKRQHATIVNEIGTMITRYTYKQITWIDVLSPTLDEIREVVLEAQIPSEFTDDLSVMVPHSESFAKKGALKLTLDYPVVRRTDMKQPHEVKFIVTKTHLVTFHYEEMEALHRFGKEFEVRCLLQSGKAPTPPQLFSILVRYLYDSMVLKLDHLQARTAAIEEGIFDEREREMVFEISELTRRLIAFRQIMNEHAYALETLHTTLVVAFGQKAEEYVRPFEQQHRHLSQRVTALTSVVDDLRNTNLALLSTKENEIMKLFTILAFITFPLTLFTSTFGMNTKDTPLIGIDYDFWIIIGIMALVSVAFFAFFKYKKWF